MKMQALGIMLSILLCQSSFAQHSEGGGMPGHAGGAPAAHESASHGPSRPMNSPRAAAHSVFPAYHNTAATPNMRARMNTPTHSLATATHDDHFGNRVSDDHLNRVQFARERESSVMRTNAHVANHVAYHGAAFTGTLHPIYERKQVVFNEQFNHYHTVVVEHPLVWRDWHAHRFYGGFYYGFHPVPDMSIYFYNPLVHWFYIGTWDDAYYRQWYAQEYDAYPQLNKPFVYYGVYYPTDNLRQLLFGVSAMPVDKQARFRDGMIAFTQKVTQAMANHLRAHVSLSNGDIAITHYETLGADDGVDLEGAVTYNGIPYNFKGLINLDQDHTTQVFMAGDETSTPSAPELQSLDKLNASMDKLRGDASPVVTPEATPSQEPAQPASGSVSADPETNPN